MSENEIQESAEEKAEEVKAETTEETKAEAPAASDDTEEISYHAVEKEGEITAIWEMQGKKHLRTISARSAEGTKILSLFTSDIHETDSPPLADQKKEEAASEEASA